MASSREVPSSIALAFCPPVLRSFSRRNPSSPRFPPLHVFSWASLRIQTRQPSTSTTIHRQRLRHLTLLEMHRLRRMFENVFSPLRSSLSVPFSSLSLFLSLSLFHPPPTLLSRHPFVTDGNLATGLLPEMLTKCSRVPPCRCIVNSLPRRLSFHDCLRPLLCFVLLEIERFVLRLKTCLKLLVNYW